MNSTKSINQYAWKVKEDSPIALPSAIIAGLSSASNATIHLPLKFALSVSTKTTIGFFYQTVSYQHSISQDLQ